MADLEPPQPVKLPPPCLVCGQQEVHVGGGIYRITHDMEKHGIPPVPSAVRRTTLHSALHDVDSLSIRQRQIAELIADGCTDKDIQSRLSLSYSTLRTHLEEIGRRLNLDATKNLRVQLTWLVVDARFEANPDYQLARPSSQREPPAAA